MRILTACILIAILAYTPPAFGAGTEKQKAVIGSIDGDVQVKKANENTWTDAKDSITLTEGDMLRTKKGSNATINIKDGKTTVTVEMREKSELGFLEFVKDTVTGVSTTLLDIATGEVIVSASKPNNSKNKFELKTPTSLISVPDERATFKVKVVKD